MILCSWTGLYHHANICVELNLKSFAALNTEFFCHEQHASYYLLYSGYHMVLPCYQTCRRWEKIFKRVRSGMLGENLEAYHTFDKGI